MSGKVRYFFAPDPERWDTGRIVHMNEHGGYDCIYKAYYNAKRGLYTLYAPDAPRLRLNVFEVNDITDRCEAAELLKLPIGRVRGGYIPTRAENGLIKAKSDAGRAGYSTSAYKPGREKKTAGKVTGRSEKQITFFDMYYERGI